MRMIVLYRPNSEHARTIEEFVREFKMRYHAEYLQMLNVDTRDGIATAALYDIVQYPAIVIIRSDGSVQKIWQGPDLPLIDEVVSYSNV
jgi:hypothetical protein